MAADKQHIGVGLRTDILVPVVVHMTGNRGGDRLNDILAVAGDRSEDTLVLGEEYETGTRGVVDDHTGIVAEVGHTPVVVDTQLGTPEDRLLDYDEEPKGQTS